MTYQKLRQYRSLKAELAQLQAGTEQHKKVIKLIAEIDKWVSFIDNSFARRVIYWKYIGVRTDAPKKTEPPTWNYVAGKVHSTEDYCKKIQKDLLKSKKSHN